ncbi:MAG TPA: hypothetical protein VL096_16810, partial [Pirellulaceae bacterium]|nr:hypothetical protein [Pirellulaceae bacterium]
IEQAIRNRSMFNIIHTASGNKLDFMLARHDAWGYEQLARRQRVFLTPELEGYVASPEDVIIGKLWYYTEGESEKHLGDIAGILRATHITIDRDYISRFADQLGFASAWQKAQTYAARSA